MLAYLGDFDCWTVWSSLHISASPWENDHLFNKRNPSFLKRVLQICYHLFNKRNPSFLKRFLQTCISQHFYWSPISSRFLQPPPNKPTHEVYPPHTSLTTLCTTSLNLDSWISMILALYRLITSFTSSSAQHPLIHAHSMIGSSFVALPLHPLIVGLWTKNLCCLINAITFIVIDRTSKIFIYNVSHTPFDCWSLNQKSVLPHFWCHIYHNW